MSTVKVNRLQIGQSSTATQNFSLEQPVTPDGTVKLVRGNAGAGSQDILTVDVSGNVLVGGNNLNLFSAKSLASSGYQKLPSGLIIQWGVTTLTGGGSYTTVTLPIAYTTTNFGVYGNAVENVGGVTSEALEFGARGLTSFEAVVLSGVNPNNSKINWISVGY